MTDCQIYTWIFLSLSKEPQSRREIIGLADAINHAIPTDIELRNAFGWLTAQGLIAKNGDKYFYTPQGEELRTKSIGPNMLLRESQSAINEYFDRILATQQ